MTNMQKGRFTELGQRLVARLGRAGARSATSMRGAEAKLAERLFDASIHPAISRVSSRVRDAIPTVRAYGELGRAKGLRAVNRGALKIVDALEGAGVMHPRQANKARIGIVSADVYDTVPFDRSNYTNGDRPLMRRSPRDKDYLTDESVLRAKLKHDPSYADGSFAPRYGRTYAQERAEVFNPEQRARRKERFPKNPMFYEDMPKGVREQFDDMAEYGLGGPYREGRNQNKTTGTYRMDTENMDTRLADSLNPDGYFDRILRDKERKVDSLYPFTEKPKSAKQKFNNAINRQYLNEVVAPTGNRVIEMRTARRTAVPKLRDNYTALRSAAGKAALIAGLGGAGGLALMMAANRKKNEQSGNSGRVNKSMAKRANTSSKYFR